MHTYGNNSNSTHLILIIVIIGIITIILVVHIIYTGACNILWICISMLKYTNIELTNQESLQRIMAPVCVVSMLK